MKSDVLTKLMILQTTVAMACVGCAHAQRPESRIHVVSESAEGVGAALATGGAGGHDCQKEHEECVERCWEQRYPWPYSEEQSGWYHENCIKKCREQFVECDEEQEQAQREREKKLAFPSMDRAIDWIREHKGEVAIGTVVIVGGVVFVLAVSPPGWLVLIPLGVAAT
jgi:hypothetical protein